MDEIPDIYADGHAVSVGPFGVTITLQRSEPGVDPGVSMTPNLIVGRIRMSAPLAKALANVLNEALAQQGFVQSESRTRH